MSKVLIVEDQTSLARVTADTLRSQNFAVTVAHDGITGLNEFLAQQFDICIVDIMMPGMDGYSFVKEIRNRDPDIPVIFLTARTLKEDVIAAFHAGGNDYVRKPFSIEELILRMEELLKRNKPGPSQESTQLRVGNYILNLSRMELEHVKETIRLTYREAEILKRFIENMNSIVTIDSILMELWGDNSFYNARSLNVFVTRIRKYLRHDEGIRIFNVRGVGYKMICGTID